MRRNDGYLGIKYVIGGSQHFPNTEAGVVSHPKQEPVPHPAPSDPEPLAWGQRGAGLVLFAQPVRLQARGLSGIRDGAGQDSRSGPDRAAGFRTVRWTRARRGGGEPRPRSVSDAGVSPTEALKPNRSKRIHKQIN